MDPPAHIRHVEKVIFDLALWSLLAAPVAFANGPHGWESKIGMRPSLTVYYAVARIKLNLIGSPKRQRGKGLRQSRVFGFYTKGDKMTMLVHIDLGSLT